jgi:hypothetical protein
MLNVICVKHGTKYSELHVNRLYNMVSRHLTIEHRFVCFTEDPASINKNIDVRPLPTNLPISGWWWKPYIFCNGHFDKTDINLFFDLDMVIIGNINKLVKQDLGYFVGLEDVGRALGKPTKLGSAVMKWHGSFYSDIWDKLQANPDIVKKFPGGDQDWIWSLHRNRIKFFPKNWIMSYKWEIRNIKELVRKNNKWYFKDVRDPEIHEDTAVLAFHGTPDMEDVQDKIIVENWQ